MRTILPIIILLLIATGCKKDPPKIMYTVECGSCDLTYDNGTGGTQQESMSSTWSFAFDGHKGQFLYISAQNNNASGSVTVHIKKDGSDIKNATSNGAYVIATASTTLPD